MGLPSLHMPGRKTKNNGAYKQYFDKAPRHHYELLAKKKTKFIVTLRKVPFIDLGNIFSSQTCLCISLPSLHMPGRKTKNNGAYGNKKVIDIFNDTQLHQGSVSMELFGILRFLM